MAARPSTIRKIEEAVNEIKPGTVFTSQMICMRKKLTCNLSVGQILKRFDKKAKCIGKGLWLRLPDETVTLNTSDDEYDYGQKSLC
jgi:hypothetical protein